MADCCACLIADTSAQLATLEKMATRTGFGQMYGGLEAWRTRNAPEPPVTFFFFHYRVDDGMLKSALTDVRRKAELNFRFSPAIAVVGDCSQEEVLRFIELGFDDIVVLPEAPRILRQRFAAQLNARITYFETQTYFGPDRRRAVRDPSAASRRGNGPTEHVRYLIQRAPGEGIRILRRDVFLSGTRISSAAPSPAAVH